MKSEVATPPELLSGCKEALIRALVPALLNGLLSPSPAVRRKAAHRLGDLGRGAEQAIPQLEMLLGDRDRKVREAAKEALSRLGQKSHRE